MLYFIVRQSVHCIHVLNCTITEPIVLISSNFTICRSHYLLSLCLSHQNKIILYLISRQFVHCMHVVLNRTITEPYLLAMNNKPFFFLWVLAHLYTVWNAVDCCAYQLLLSINYGLSLGQVPTQHAFFKRAFSCSGAFMHFAQAHRCLQKFGQCIHAEPHKCQAPGQMFVYVSHVGVGVGGNQLVAIFSCHESLKQTATNWSRGSGKWQPTCLPWYLCWDDLIERESSWE